MDTEQQITLQFKDLNNGLEFFFIVVYAICDRD